MPLLPDIAAMPEFWVPIGLLVLFLISFLSSSQVPMPMTITVMWLGQYDFPVAVVLVATLGTLLGWMFFDTYIKRWLLKIPRIQQRIPVAYQKFFLRQTGWWLFVFNALPFPWDPVRFLALINGYSRTRMLSILAVARLIRNTMLVTLGAVLIAYKTLFWTVLVFFLVLPFLLNWLLDRWLSRGMAADTPIEYPG